MHGCADRYFPPQCYPNPREQCALIFATTPVWLGSYLQGQVRSLNLSLGVAFLNVAAFGSPAFVSNPSQLNLLMYSDGNQQATNSECAFGDKRPRCWQRLQLPMYSSLCANLYNGNFTSEYSCDFPLSQQIKYARPDLKTEAPRADFFLQELDFNGADTFFFFQQPELRSSSRTQDHKSVACRWIRQPENRARWQSWIAPPAACTMADTRFTVSHCDESTAARTISYSWRQPKACVGGWPLPEPEQVSCGYVTASLSWQLACMVVAAVLLFGVVVSISLRVLESFSLHWSERKAAAETAKVRSKAAGKAHIITIATTAPVPSKLMALISFRRRMPIFDYAIAPSIL